MPQPHTLATHPWTHLTQQRSFGSNHDAAKGKHHGLGSNSPAQPARSNLGVASNAVSVPIMMLQGEKYYIALGQSPEAIALMKTDPLRFGSKVSKIE